MSQQPALSVAAAFRYVSSYACFRSSCNASRQTYPSSCLSGYSFSYRDAMSRVHSRQSNPIGRMRLAASACSCPLSCRTQMPRTSSKYDFVALPAAALKSCAESRHHPSLDSQKVLSQPDLVAPTAPAHTTRHMQPGIIPIETV